LFTNLIAIHFRHHNIEKYQIRHVLHSRCVCFSTLITESKLILVFQYLVNYLQDDSEILQMASKIALAHHEKFDGTGITESKLILVFQYLVNYLQVAGLVIDGQDFVFSHFPYF